MTSILETQVTTLLTTSLGRAPTSAEVANALVAPWSLAQTHNTLNVPQSVFTITDSDDMQTAIDNLSSNGGGVLNLLPGTYVLLADITIPTGVSINGAGPTNTQIVGAVGHGFVAHGSSGTHLTDMAFTNLGFFSGTGTMLDIQYADRVILSNCLFSGNNKGIVFDEVTQSNWSTVVVVSSTSDGITVSNSSLMDWRSVNAISNGGIGLVLDTVSTLSLIPGDFESNTSHGISMDTCESINMLVACPTNGGDGINLVSTDNCKFTFGTLAANGAYGINITNAGCDNTIIIGNTFASNTSGAVNDSGTGTLIRSNIGVADAP